MNQLEEIKVRASKAGAGLALTPTSWGRHLMTLVTEDVPRLVAIVEAMDDLVDLYQGSRSEAELMAEDVGRVLKRLE